jgi:transcriptional regulator with XRE-family HTH domain
MTRVSPTVAQFEFAARVRRQRESEGIPAQEVSNRLGFSRNAYSAIENSHRLLTPSKLGLLLDVLNFDAEEIQALSDLLGVARSRAWWHEYSATLSDEVIQFFGLEFGARTISSYESLVFNGLLQAPEYAKSVIRASPNYAPLGARKALEIRLRRQKELLASGDPPDMTFLLSEAVLRQHFGGPEVLRKQLVHILNLADELGAKLDIRVQTFDVTPLGLTTASTLALLGFGGPHLRPVGYREAGTPLGLVGDPQLIEILRLHFDQALDSSSTREESLELISQRVRQLG